MADKPQYLTDEQLGIGKGDNEQAPKQYLKESDLGIEPEQGSNIARGFKTAMRQVPQTFGGAAALVGDAVGSKGLNEWGMDVYQSQGEKIQELSRDNDSFTKAISGDGNLADWAGYGAGYVGGQALQAAATGGAGAFVGKKVAEIAAKKAIQSGVERGIAKEVAEKAASEMVSKGIKRGAATGAYASNLMQEAGSIYPEALATAKEEGRLQEDGGLSGADLVRAGGAAAGAAALDTLMEAKMLKGVLGGGSATDANMLKRIAKEAGKGAGREALTEGAQTGIERWGAQQSLGDKEAVTDYIDSAAMGALGGAMGGAGAGVRSPNSGENPASSSAINNEAATQAEPGQPLQLGNSPDPLIQFRDGTVARQSEIDAHLASLPESERQTFVAQILGYAPQQADEPQLTTSPGATQFDGAATEQPSASIAAPDFGTSLGAQPEPQGGGLDFQRQIDTSGLSLERLDSPFAQPVPATALDRQALARQGAYPTSPTPAPVLDTRRLSEKLGLSSNRGGLEAAAAMAVDSGASPISQTANTNAFKQGGINGTQTQEAQQAVAGQSQGAGAQERVAAAPKIRAVKLKDGTTAHVNEADLTSGASLLRTFTADGKPRAARLQATHIAPAAPKVVLQNRNRATPASIAQMNAIAGKPDFLRAGASNTMDNGAPIVFGDLPQKVAIGRAQMVADGNGQRVPTQYAVVEAQDLITSNHADGSPVAEYANGVDGKLRAVAGNGRAAGLKAAWQRGTAGQYGQELMQDAPNLGIAPEVLAQFEAPVLVRVMDAADVTPDMGDRSNVQAGLQMSAVEQASNDAQRLNLRDMEFDELGNPTAQTVMRFMQGMPVQERGNMLDSQGRATSQLLDRIRAAAFKQAYMSDSLVELAAQSADPEAKNILNGLAIVAGDMAQLAGAGDFDIRQAVTDAANMAVTASRTGQSMAQYLQTRQIDENPETVVVMQFMAQNVRSAKRIADGLRAWAELAQSQIAIARQNAEQDAMFGDTPTLSRRELFERLNNDNLTEIEQQQLIEQQRRAELAEQGAQRPSTERAGNADGASDGAESRGTEPTNAQDAGREQADFALAQQTPEQIRAQEEAQAQAARDKAQADARAAEAERKAVERQEVTQRSEAAANDFQLWQSAEDNLSGQGDIFAQQQEADAESLRFEVGKSLTNAQRQQVLASLVDAYKAKEAQREFKGLDGNGNERYGYIYSPDLFEKSDITGAMVRYYVTLPDGRIAHPSELFPEVSASDVERMALEQNAKRIRLDAYENAIKPYYSDFDSANLMAAQDQVVIEKSGRFAIIPKRPGAIGQARQNGWGLASPSGQESEQGSGTRAVREQQEATPEAPPKTLKEGLERVRAKKAAEKPAKNDATRLGSGATGVADNALSGKDAGAPYQYFEEKTGLIRDVPSMSNRDGTLNDDGKRLAYTEWSAMSEDERALIHEAIAARKTRSQQADDSVRKEYLRAEKARLEGERIILSSNGNPYKTEGAAAKFIEGKGIEESHYAGKVDGGWAAIRRTPSEMLTRENEKKGIEDYTTIQERIVGEMGLTQAWSQDAITDAQWEEIDKRVDAIQRQQRGLPAIEQPPQPATPPKTLKEGIEQARAKKAAEKAEKTANEVPVKQVEPAAARDSAESNTETAAAVNQPSRPDKWRGNKTQAAKVARDLGLKLDIPKISILDLVRAIDAHDAKANGQEVVAAPAKPKKNTPFAVGNTPSDTEKVTVRDGTVFLDEYEAIDYESGEPVTVPKGSTRGDVVKALRDAGAINKNTKVFGASGEQANDLAFSRNTGRQNDGIEGVRDLVVLHNLTEDNLRNAASRAYGKLLERLEAKGLVHVAQTEEDALQAAAKARAAKTGQSVGEALEGLRQSVQNSIAVWHGTPHRGIEKTGFKLNKIGTGEGAQAYGWGIYFASQRVVAEGYRSSVSAQRGRLTLDGELLESHQNIAFREVAKQLEKRVSDFSSPTVDDVERALRELPASEAKKRLLDQFKRGRLKHDVGQLYSANIPESHELLDWDKPLSEQPKKVLDALKSAGILYKPTMTGRAFYQNIQRNPTHYFDKVLSGLELTGAYIYPDRGASMFLNALGIPGLRYLDGNSRADGRGSHNYVIWDEALLTPEAAQIDAKFSKDGAIEGFFDRQTGKSFLVADGLTEETAPATLMHEVGIHMAADGSMQGVFNRAAMLVKNSKDEFMNRVRDRMEAAGETSAEEAAAYIVTEYEKDRTNAPASIKQFMKDFMAAVRAWLFRNGFTQVVKEGSITPADISAIARANARSLAQGGQVAPSVDNQTYAINEPNAPYETDLFGEKVQAPRVRNKNGVKPDSTPIGNTQPATTLSDTAAPDGEYYVKTIVGSEVERKLGASRISTAADAARATAYLYRSAVERLDGIITDKDGKPLAVVGGFKGALSQASVYPGTIMGEAIRVPGAARIWFSHNHPSGSSTLSSADKTLFTRLVDIFNGSGIEPMGMLAVSNGEFSSIATNEDPVQSQAIPSPSVVGAKVPVIERELAINANGREEVNSPAVAMGIARKLHSAGGDGIMLFDSQMRLSAWVPISDVMRGTLRHTGGLAAVYRAISESNAGSAILVHDGSLNAIHRDSRSITVGNNIAAALRQLEVSPLDIINIKTLTSAAQSGGVVAAGPVYSKESPAEARVRELVAQYANTEGAPTEAEIREAVRQYHGTERAYGGQDAYAKAKADGKTKLNYNQWVQVRTPNFKAWFGPAIENAVIRNILSADLPSGGPITEVLSRMSTAILDSEILNPVISLIPVNMVNKLGGEEATANVLLHDPTMLVDVATVAGVNADIIVSASDFARAAESIVAVARTKLGATKPTAANAEMFAAIDALQNNLVFVWRRLAGISGPGTLQDVSVQTLLHRLALAGIGAKPTPALDVLLGSVKDGAATLARESRPILLRQLLTGHRAELTATSNEGGLGIELDTALLANSFHAKDYKAELGRVQEAANASKVVDSETGEPLVGRELAVAMYERGASSATVAKAMGDVSVATVKRWVSEAGTQRTASEARGGTKENRAEAVRLYGEGLGAFAIAERLGVSNRGVYNWLRDAGVEIRSLSEAQALRAAQGRQPIRGVRSTVATKWGEIRTDSVYEAARLRQLETDQEVESVARAIESIKWGKNQRYTPDFVVTMKDGRVRVEEVKPTFQQDRDDVVAKAEAARESLGSDADYKMVVTEDLASGFVALRDMAGLSFASDADRGRFKRALATAKSATGNSGAFDGANPDIRFSRAAPTAGAGVWQSPEPTKFDQWTYLLQDKQIDTKRVLNAIKSTGQQVDDAQDVYLQETLYHGRTAKRVKGFAEQEERPLMELMRDKGLSLGQVEEYLHARHAPEVNREMSERNPNQAMIDANRKAANAELARIETALQQNPNDATLKAELKEAQAEADKWRLAKPYGGTEQERTALSGMSDAEAAAVMTSLTPENRKALQDVAALVDGIIAKTRETIVDYGLETQETVDAWGKSWQNYVPLMREQPEDSGMAGMGTGQGFSVKGKETKGRTGSTKKVVDILANIAAQRERAIVRGEKNRVATALLGLVEANENKDFWRIAKPGEIPSTKVIDKKTGLVTTQIDPTYKGRDNALVAKVDGVEQVILFNEDNPRAMRMATALKNMDAANLEGLLGSVGAMTRYLAAINTQYNPIFGITNMVRDFQEAAVNLQTTPLAGQQKKVLGNALTAAFGIGKELRAQRNGKTAGGAWGKLWDEFQNEGGQTGYRDMFANSADRSKALQAMLEPDAWADGKLGKFFTANGTLKAPMEFVRKSALRPVLDLLSDYNEAIENGIRLSAYKAALDHGLSKARAAELAKNLTVNFNRKGQTAQQVGALYAFFNASVQGTARMGKTLFDMEPGKPKTLRLSSLGKKIVTGGVLLGSVQALLLAGAGFDEDEPPEFIRERNLVIPNPMSDKGYITIPMPLGYHVLSNIGRIPTEYALGGFKNGGKRAFDLLDVLADIYNPLGGSGLSMQTITPSVIDPLAALAENKDFSGRAIAKVSFDKTTPGHALGRDTSSMLAQGMAQVINYATGGTEYTRGELSPTPDQIDYLIGQVTGGVGREASKVSQSTQAIATGDELPWHKVPLIGRFYGSADTPAAVQSAYYATMDDVRRHAAEVKGFRNDGRGQEAVAYMQENPQAGMHFAANAAERQVKKLRERISDLKEQGAPREVVKAVETQMVEVMQRFSAAVENRKKLVSA